MKKKPKQPRLWVWVVLWQTGSGVWRIRDFWWTACGAKMGACRGDRIKRVEVKT